MIRKIEQKLNNEFHPIKFKIKAPDLKVGRCDYEVTATAQVDVKPYDEDWRIQKVESTIRIAFVPSGILARAFGKEMFTKINTMFNTMKITKRIMKPTKTGLKLAKTVVLLKYEDWRFADE